jgi:hypothetical protein
MSLDVPDDQITLTAAQLAVVALSTIRAVIGDVKYQYLSGPINGGRKYLDWHLTTGRGISEPDYKRAREVAVVFPNIADVKAAAKAEREAERNTIEPGSFEADFKQWGQKEFLYFWEKVIEEHAACVRFMDGWAYSAGCAFEYLCALRCGLETCDMQGQALGPETALSLLDAALADIWTQADVDNPQDAPLIKLHGAICGYREEIGKFAG